MRLFDLFLGPNGWGLPLLCAALMTVALSVSGLVVGAVLGALLAYARIAGGFIARTAADAITTVLRGVPDLLVIYLFYFGGSQILSWIGNAAGYGGFIGLPVFLTGVLALGVVSAAYQAEVFRGAFNVIPRGQIESARAAGMGPLLMFRRVLAPQVFRHALPGMGNVWQLILKDSALISVIGLVELLRAAQVGAGSTREPFLFYSAALLLYLAITSLSGQAFRWAEIRSLRPFRRG
ncbi:ABC transporter permease [Azospirillum sp. B510]|uniref:ABC transporter permease n=1 Tax=Azospirillum sp. (strain B510) TaxID=137722 RepID=UPI00031BC978|nr:ABC transporter permease subunit [Azospirillum sp. B510]